jgi:phage head maturation protease
MSDPYWLLERSPPAVRLRSNPDGSKTMFGRFVSAGEWAEIRSEREGHFLEQVSQRAFAVSIHNDRDTIRVLYHHGRDPFIGTRVLGTIRSLEPDTSYEVDLFDVDYARSLVPGLKAGVYGTSFWARVLRDEIEPKPQRTSWNPNRLPQVRIVKADLVEFGPTPTPAYKGTTATTSVRSSDPPAEHRVGITHDLATDERWVTRSKPGSPGVYERQRVRDGELASWEHEPDQPWWYLGDLPKPWLQPREPWWVLR